MKKIIAIAVLGAAAATAYVLACGPFLTELRTVATVLPPHLQHSGRGHLGFRKTSRERPLLHSVAVAKTSG